MFGHLKQPFVAVWARLTERASLRLAIESLAAPWLVAMHSCDAVWSSEGIALLEFPGKSQPAERDPARLCVH